MAFNQAFCHGCGTQQVAYNWRRGGGGPPHDLVNVPLCHDCYWTKDRVDRIRRFLATMPNLDTGVGQPAVVEAIMRCNCGWETPYPIAPVSNYRCGQCRSMAQVFA